MSGNQQPKPGAQNHNEKQNPSGNTKDKPNEKPKEKKIKCAFACDPSDAAAAFAAKKARIRASKPNLPTYGPWMKAYQRHLKALEETQATIDCRDPIVPRDNYAQIKRYNMRGEAFQRIEMDNALLLRKIAGIFCTGGNIDNRLDKSCKSIDHRGLNRERNTVKLMHENYRIEESLKRVKPIISRRAHTEWYAQQEKYMSEISLYPLHFKPLPCSKSYKKIINNASKNPKQFAYLQVEVEDTMVSNLICELFANFCPFTAMNFQKLCTNNKSNEDCACRSYRCKKIEKLVTIPTPNGEYVRAYWQVGETVDAIPEYSQYMMKEDSPLKHTKVGYLTRPKGVATGEFYITLGNAPYLDGLCYVFGRVIGPGMPFLKKVEETYIDTHGNTKKWIHITDCGVAEKPEKVPRPMLMSKFINEVKDKVIPFVARVDDDKN